MVTWKGKSNWSQTKCLIDMAQTIAIYLRRISLKHQLKRIVAGAQWTLTVSSHASERTDKASIATGVELSESCLTRASMPQLENDDTPVRNKTRIKPVT